MTRLHVCETAQRQATFERTELSGKTPDSGFHRVDLFLFDGDSQQLAEAAGGVAFLFDMLFYIVISVSGSAGSRSGSP